MRRSWLIGSIGAFAGVLACGSELDLTLPDSAISDGGVVIGADGATSGPDGSGVVDATAPCDRPVFLEDFATPADGKAWSPALNGWTRIGAYSVDEEAHRITFFGGSVSGGGSGDNGMDGGTNGNYLERAIDGSCSEVTITFTYAWTGAVPFQMLAVLTTNDAGVTFAYETNGAYFVTLRKPDGSVERADIGGIGINAGPPQQSEHPFTATLSRDGRVQVTIGGTTQTIPASGLDLTYSRLRVGVVDGGTTETRLSVGPIEVR